MPAATPVVEQLVAGAELVVRGRVVAQTSHWDESRTSIVTDSTVAVHYVVFGRALAGTAGDAPDEVVVRTLGGEIAGDGLGLRVTHEAELIAGEEVLLFLAREGAAPYSVVGGELGEVTVAGTTAHAEWLPAGVASEALIKQTALTAQALGQTSRLPENWQAREAAAAATSSLPSSADAVNDYVFTGIYWSGNAPNIEYVVNINTNQANGANGTAADFLAAIRTAGETWNQVTTADFSFRYAGSTAVTSVSNANGINEVIFSPAGQNQVLGQTRYWYDPATSTMLEADIWFNDSYVWDATGAPAGNEIDLQSVALHEFGHWFVLGHDSEVAAIMYFSIGAGLVKRSLSATDIAGISAIYPCEALPCGPSGGEPEPTEPPEPTEIPTEAPTEIPTELPTIPPPPTPEPTVTPIGSVEPTVAPTVVPTETVTPTVAPPYTPVPTPDAPTPTPPEPPEPEVVVEIVPGEDTIVWFGDEEEQPELVLEIPGEAFDQVTNLGYAALPAPPATFSRRGAYAGAHFVLTAEQAGSDVDGLTFLTSVRFEVSYPTPAEAIDQEAVRLFYLDDTQQWQLAACGSEAVNTERNTVSAEVCRTGQFALFELVSEDVQGAIFLPLVLR